jgi:hypothetical protein
MLRNFILVAMLQNIQLQSEPYLQPITGFHDAIAADHYSNVDVIVVKEYQSTSGCNIIKESADDFESVEESSFTIELHISLYCMTNVLEADAAKLHLGLVADTKFNLCSI